MSTTPNKFKPQELSTKQPDGSYSNRAIFEELLGEDLSLPPQEDLNKVEDRLLTLQDKIDALKARKDKPSG